MDLIGEFCSLTEVNFYFSGTCNFTVLSGLEEVFRLSKDFLLCNTWYM